MPATLPNRPTALGRELDASPDCLGLLRPSSDALGDTSALRERMRADGYLFLPGYLDRELVLAARAVMVERLRAEGSLAPDRSADEAVALPGVDFKFRPDLARDNEPLRRLLYDGPVMDLYARLLGGEVRHYDYTWIRAVTPGVGTSPHCDMVYMGRGTTELYTAWTPLGDVSYEMGGLMILEGSHQHPGIRERYCRKDVDAWCTNLRPEPPGGLGGGGNIASGGVLSRNPVSLRSGVGGRWLTSEFAAGDLLTFGMFTAHASLDNHTDRIRLSSDSRYQLASEPIDERWIGDNPIGHSAAAKRGRVC